MSAAGSRGAPLPARGARRGGASTSALGREGEELVARALESEGWSVLARNFRAGRGEIDLVTLKDGILAFVEVKAWRALGASDLADSVNARKRRRIVETAQIFLARNRQYSDAMIRFDLVLVDGEGIRRRIESAFTGEL